MDPLAPAKSASGHNPPVGWTECEGRGCTYTLYMEPTIDVLVPLPVTSNFSWKLGIPMMDEMRDPAAN